MQYSGVQFYVNRNVMYKPIFNNKAKTTHKFFIFT